MGIGKAESPGQLDAVPFAVDFGEWVDIVIRGAAIGDAHILPHAKWEDAGSAVTVALVKGGWRGRKRSRSESPAEYKPQHSGVCYRDR